jgi:hypothetical protein
MPNIGVFVCPDTNLFFFLARYTPLNPWRRFPLIPGCGDVAKYCIYVAILVP